MPATRTQSNRLLGGGTKRLLPMSVLIPPRSPPAGSWYDPDCPPGLPESAQNGSVRFPLSLRCTGAWSSSTFEYVTLVLDRNVLYSNVKVMDNRV